MLLEKIAHLEIFRPKCDSTKEVLHAIAELEVDISPSLPYLNAELGGWDYDALNQVLLLKMSPGKWVTLQPRQVAIRGCRDTEEARALAEWIKNQVNEIYARRDSITPRYTGQAGLKVMEILKLLPLTNCKACGYATCMAFAAALREGEITLADCSPLQEEKFREKLAVLHDYLQSYGWRALDDA
ncbi:MAG: (Fe-S)-binding protein [Thermodesulfobacteriota bacterium]